MSLDFNYKDCDKSLLTDEHYEQTCSLVVYNTMFVGINHITDESIFRFAQRVMILNASMNNVYGPDSYQGWIDILRPWVGLRTNASAMTEAAFWKMCRERAQSTMRSTIHAYEKEKV